MKYILTFDKFFEGRKTKHNRKEYEFYVFNTEKSKIVGAYEYKEDANDRRKEILEDNEDMENVLKVYSKKTLLSKKIDPNENNNWSN